MDKDCSCNGEPGVIYVSIHGLAVGLVGIPELFQPWLEGGRAAEELTEEEILQALRKRNHVPAVVEKEYASALRSLFSARIRRLKEARRS